MLVKGVTGVSQTKQPKVCKTFRIIANQNLILKKCDTLCIEPIVCVVLWFVQPSDKTTYGNHPSVLHIKKTYMATEMVIAESMLVS